MTDVVLTDALVLTMDPQRRAFRDGYVWIRDEVVHQVGSMGALPPLPTGAGVRSMRGRHVVMPGLVNTHDHISNNVVRGTFDEGSHEDYGTRMFAALRALDGDASHAGAMSSLVEQLQGGITTTQAGEFGHRDRPSGVLRAARESGLRVVFSLAFTDSADETVNALSVPQEFRETPDEAVGQLEALHGEFASPLITVAPEALSPMRCTPEMISSLHLYAVARDTPLFIHLGAAADEMEESQRRYGVTTVGFLAGLGVLAPKTVLAHANYVDEQDNALLAEYGTGVAHCPVANIWAGGRIPMLAEWLEADVRVGLGTDGATSNNGQNLWETAKMAVLLQKFRLADRTYASAGLGLELLTIGGARAMHMEDRIGSLEPGKQADVICIDIDRPTLTPRETVTSNLVYSHDRSAVRHVYVAGAEQLRDGVPVNLDVDAIVARVKEQAGMVIAAPGVGLGFAERSLVNWVDD
jgi:5-methylthioadenosine/S-adenosylhomocysteine deaminase